MILHGDVVDKFLKTIDLKKYEYKKGMDIGPKLYQSYGLGTKYPCKEFVPRNISYF